MTWYRITTSVIHTPEGTFEPGDYIEDPPESVLEGFADNLVEDEPDSTAEVEAEESRSAIEAEEAPNHGPGTHGDTQEPSEAERTHEEPPESDDATDQEGGEQPGDEAEEEETDTEAEDTESSDESVVPDDYDSFNVSEVREWLDSTDLSDEDLETVKEYETSQKDRTTVKNEIDERRSAE